MNLYGQGLAGMGITSSTEYPAYPGYALDGLDSFKQAVLARKAPTQLRLAPRERLKTIHSGL